MYAKLLRIYNIGWGRDYAFKLQIFLRFQNKVILPVFGFSSLLSHYLDDVLMQKG